MDATSSEDEEEEGETTDAETCCSDDSGGGEGCEDGETNNVDEVDQESSREQRQMDGVGRYVSEHFVQILPNPDLPGHDAILRTAQSLLRCRIDAPSCLCFHF